MLIRLTKRSSDKRSANKRMDVVASQIRAIHDDGQGQPGAVEFLDGSVVEVKESGQSIRGAYIKARSASSDSD